MCTHERLLYHLECYFDSMVNCFEEIVEKSMLVISFAVGTLVLMMMYGLKLISDRAANRQITNMIDDTDFTVRIKKSRVLSLTEITPNVHTSMVLSLTEITPNVHTPYESSKNLLENNVPSLEDLCKRAIYLQVIPTHSSFDDNFTQEVELCVISKPCDSCKQTQVSEDLKNARTESNYWLPKQSCLFKNGGMDLLLNNITSFKKSVEEGMYPDPQSTARQCTKHLVPGISCCSVCCKEGPTSE